MVTEFTNNICCIIPFYTDIPLAIWSLLKNPVYMMVNVASAAEFSIITGFVRFVPKFVQSQFDVNAAVANLITGLWLFLLWLFCAIVQMYKRVMLIKAAFALD